MSGVKLRSVTLYKAATAERDTFGHLTSWTSSATHAQRYRSVPGFGGPVIYTTEVAVPADVVADLDAPGAEAFYDPADYEGEQRHDVVRCLARLFVGRGFEWVTFDDSPPGALDDEWLYLGDDPLTADSVIR